MAPFLYTVSLLHCMPQGLRDHGLGLGMMWCEHSVNFREHSVNFREHSVNFREHSVNIQC
jgi:hypothetical protein